MNQTAPEGYTSVAPWIVTDDTGALLDFITAVFDGTELARVPVEDGTIGHGEIRVGDTVLLAFDRRPDWPAMPSLLRVYVPDADAAIAAAAARMARESSTEAADSAWGDRGGRIRDPFGNIWWVVSRTEQVSPDQSWQRMSEPRVRRRDARCPADAGRGTQRPTDRRQHPAAPDPLIYVALTEVPPAHCGPPPRSLGRPLSASCAAVAPEGSTFAI